MTSASTLTPDQIKKIRKKFIPPASYTAFSIILLGLGIVAAIAEPFHYQEGAVEFCLVMSAVLGLNAVYSFGTVFVSIVELIFARFDAMQNR